MYIKKIYFYTNRLEINWGLTMDFRTFILAKIANTISAWETSRPESHTDDNLQFKMTDLNVSPKSDRSSVDCAYRGFHTTEIINYSNSSTVR